MADYKSTSIDGIDDIQDQGGNERLETILGTEIDTSTGAVLYDITGIPPGIKEIKIMVVGASTNGTSGYLIQLGTSAGIAITGYVGGSAGDGTARRDANSAGFRLSSNATAAEVAQISCVLSLENSSTFTWNQFGHLNKGGNSENWYSVGNKSLSAILDRIRFTTIGGTDTFDAGVLNIQMRF